MNLQENSEITSKEMDEKTFDIIPALNVFKGLPVIKGDKGYEPMRDEEGKDIKILELIDELSERFDKVMITDLNGINKDRPQLELLKQLSGKMEMWVDAGSRFSEGAIDIIIAGADKVVFGTKTLRHLDQIEDALELSENVILGIDYDDGIISPNKDIRDMTPAHLAELSVSYGIKEIIFSDLKHLTSSTRFASDIGYTLLDKDMDIYFHGRFEDDMKMMRNKGVFGAISEVETLL
jgi:uncharacterized protein related to proFAR isomerase